MSTPETPNTAPECIRSRTKMRKILPWVYASIALAIIAAAALRTTTLTPADFPDMLLTTEKIILVRHNPKSIDTLMSNPKDIQEFVSKMELREKASCECAFVEYLEFHTDRGILRVFLSDHCLIVGPKGKGNIRGSIECEMPLELWKLYQSHLACLPKPQPPAKPKATATPQ
jgi:hypothetical protein